MRINKGLLAGLVVLSAFSAQAAEKSFPVKFRQAIVQDGQLIHETQKSAYGFRVEIVSDTDGVKTEAFKNGRPFLTASKGENYSVRLYNPLPVRVAVNLTVDGLNSITGKPSGITDGNKWMIEPYSSVTIPGWQVSGGEARRFFFTDKPKSYAKWSGDQSGKDLSVNCGVIGAAYFWSQNELDQYYDSHPIYRYTQRPLPYSSNSGVKSMDRMAEAAPRAQASQAYDLNELKKEEPREKAGTGMGERESHPTIQVAFDYDRGMYSVSQAVVLYYDFAPVAAPNPFPALGYAPEMP
jgi:hypothetical protein